METGASRWALYPNKCDRCSDLCSVRDISRLVSRRPSRRRVLRCHGLTDARYINAMLR